MYFQPENNHDTIIAKKLHFNYRFKHGLKMTFLFNFYAETEEVETLGEKQLGKQSYLATSGEDIREAHTIVASWFTNSLLSLLYSSIDG